MNTVRNNENKDTKEKRIGHNYAVQNHSNRDKDLVPVHDESHEKPK